MSNLIPRQEDVEDIPFVVQAQLAELPQEAQRDFLIEYQRRKKDVPMAYLAHMLTLSEGYLDSWTLQIFFWLSFSVGIGPFWWIINLFRLPGKVRRYNKNMASKVLRYINYKHRISGKTTLESLRRGKLFEKPSRYIKQRQQVLHPREWIIQDVSMLTVENLRMGYIFDHGTETWEVVSEAQYDWDDGLSEKLFKVKQLGEIDSILLLVNRDASHITVHKAMPVNIFAIDEGLEIEILQKKRPFNILHYQEVPYFREYSKTGNAFNLSNKAQQPTEIVSWTYFDESRRRLLRIERHGEESFKAFAGAIASPFDFTEIMKKDEE